MNTADKIIEANKFIYDKMGVDYDIIDGRRSKSLYFWLRKKLKEISDLAGENKIFLDIGCGTGFVIEASRGLFLKSYGLDVSVNVLRDLASKKIPTACGIAESLPFKNESVDIVTLFAAMHHFYNHEPVLNEIRRILKPSGILYIDHDIDKYFFRKFGFLVNIHRRLFRKKHIFKEENFEEIYNMSEFHSNGIDSEAIKKYLNNIGLNVVSSNYHWYGLSGISNFIFSDRPSSLGTAPLFECIARK